MTTIFVHTALFKAEKGGFNELHMKITVDMASTYTLQFIENGPDYEKEEKSYIHNIHYLPYSFMSMIYATVGKYPEFGKYAKIKNTRKKYATTKIRCCYDRNI